MTGDINPTPRGTLFVFSPFVPRTFSRLPSQIAHIISCWEDDRSCAKWPDRVMFYRTHVAAPRHITADQVRGSSPHALVVSAIHPHVSAVPGSNLAMSGKSILMDYEPLHRQLAFLATLKRSG
ncbi:hypothetical protein BaRGS_00010204 [Batillaria attramentaria]|uniref:Uncharacterized protein n=1 Tax=Batillaria attramentaria TaxID=370345 RepID=A0ABD0LGD2_9CAEN